MADLNGKIAVITGAANGIGRATVEIFVNAGARVLAADIRDDDGQALQREFGADHVRYIHCDVTKRDDLDNAMRRCVEAFGGLDILFNNAGAGGSAAGLAEFDEAGFDTTVALLLKSVFLGTHLAIPHMQRRGGGVVINTASISGAYAGHAPIAYSICKAGVAHFSKLGAAELARFNIRVNAVLPGLIGTDIFSKGLGLDAAGSQAMLDLIKERAKDNQPVGRIGKPGDVGELVAFLASDAASFINGVAYTVDGGSTVGPAASWQSASSTEALARMLGLDDLASDEKSDAAAVA